MSTILDASDRQSATWQKLKKYYAERLEKMRRANDSPKSTEQETAVRRGRIGEIAAFLKLEQELPPHEPDNPPDAA